MAEQLPLTIALLSRTPAALDSLLRGLPDAWIAHNEGGETWTVLEVVGHLTYGEHTDWIPRARSILRHGDSQHFEPFDRLGHVRQIEGKTLNQVLDEFSEARAQSLKELEAWNLDPSQLALRGRHPALGIVTLGELLATWAVHDLTHLHQISRIMAYQFRDKVGPFSDYLGVLQCAGHSKP